MKTIMKKLTAGLIAFCMILTAVPATTSRAAALEISYNGHSYLYQDIQPKIVYGGKTISLANSPALIVDNVAMVPYYDVFVQNGPKAKKEGYSKATKQLVVSFNGTKIVMTVNSRTAYVNGVEKTLPVAPISVTYKNTKTTRILVPSRAICSYWGIEYSWNKATRTVSMTPPPTVSTGNTRTYYRNSRTYKAKPCSVSFEGTTISLAKTPALTINKYNMVPYYTALCKNGPKVKRSYDSKTKVLKLSYHSNVLTMKVGSRSADLNGEKLTLPVAPFTIKYTKKGSNYIMLPIKPVALYLGIQYHYTSSGRAVALEDGLSVKYDNKYYSYTGKQNSIYVDGVKVKTNMPSINIGGIPYLPAYFACQSQYGLGVSYSYKSKKVTLDNGFHKITMTMGSSIAEVDGEKKSMPGKARLVRLTARKTNYVMVPAQFVCENLDLTYLYSGSTISLKPSQNTGIDTSIPVSSDHKYNYTLAAYAAKQKEQNDKAGLYKTTTLSQYQDYINPAKDTTEKFQFLRLDTYRPMNTTALTALLATSGKGGVLEGKATVMNNAAKRNKLDPVYFVSQCVHETAWGKSKLSQGITSNVLACPIYNSKGEIIGFKKDAKGNYETQATPNNKNYTAYNLFGIKAYDGAAELCGFTYAYYNNWFSVDAAIEGGAKYIKENYVHNSLYKQYTLYKYRFHPTDLGHQYATDPGYATKTASYMKGFKNLYLSNAIFQYEYPVFNQ